MAQHITKSELLNKSKAELLDLAKELDIAGHQKLNKSELMMAILNRLDQNSNSSVSTAPQQSFFAKYSNHIYGIASLIGLVLAVIAFLPKDQSTNETKTTQQKAKVSNPDILPSDVLEKKVAVMIFDDESGDDGLSKLGLMISDWIANGLTDVNSGNVISAANVRDNVVHASVGGGAQPSFAEATGAEVLIQGRYYTVEEQVYIHSNIVDARSGTIIQAIDPVSGPKDQVMDLVDELTQRVLGFWASSQLSRYHRKPPKYRAYKAFTEALDTYHDNDAVTEKKLYEAYRLDSTYFEPLLKLIPMYGNHSQNAKVGPIIEQIEKLNPDFTEYEKLRFESLKAGHNQDAKRELELEEQMAEIAPIHLYGAGLRNIQAHKPQRGLHYLEREIRSATDKNQSWWDQAPEQVKMQALFALGRYDDAIAYADSLQLNCKNEGYAIFHLLALAAKGDWNTFDRYYQDYKKMDPFYMPAIGIVNSYLYINDMPQLSTYLPDQLTQLQAMPEERYFVNFYMGYHYYMMGEYMKAYEYFSENQDWHGEAAHALVKAGYPNRARQLMDDSKDQDITDRGESRKAYNQAVYLTALGQKEEAVHALKQAYANGYPFGWIQYVRDPLLKDLHGYPPFDAFIEPKG